LYDAASGGGDTKVTDYIYNGRGAAVGYVRGNYIHDMHGSAVGQLNGTSVHKLRGAYVGELDRGMVIRRNANGGNIGYPGNPENSGAPGNPGNRGSDGRGHLDVSSKLFED
jgi:hypothetical protein